MLAGCRISKLAALSGWGGIRTHGGVSPTPVFKTGALNHSATHPETCNKRVRQVWILGGRERFANGRGQETGTDLGGSGFPAVAGQDGCDVVFPAGFEGGGDELVAGDLGGGGGLYDPADGGFVHHFVEAVGTQQ